MLIAEDLYVLRLYFILFFVPIIARTVHSKTFV